MVKAKNRAVILNRPLTIQNRPPAFDVGGGDLGPCAVRATFADWRPVAAGEIEARTINLTDRMESQKRGVLRWRPRPCGAASSIKWPQPG
jgi:hypothetical protein